MKNTAIAFAAGAACATAASVILLASPMLRADQATAPAAKPASTQAPQGAPPTAKPDEGLRVDRKLIDGEFMGKLIGHLARSPGCLGVDSGQFRSGKGVIFAWFCDRDAAKEFYYSDIHQDAIARSGYAEGTGKPMAGIKNSDGPIMIVASAKQGPPDPAKPEAGPTMELSIEMYSALPGGVRFGGGGFAPAEFAALANKHNEAAKSAGTAPAAPTAAPAAAPSTAR